MRYLGKLAFGILIFVLFSISCQEDNESIEIIEQFELPFIQSPNSLTYDGTNFYITRQYADIFILSSEGKKVKDINRAGISIVWDGFDLKLGYGKEINTISTLGVDVENCNVEDSTINIKKIAFDGEFIWAYSKNYIHKLSTACEVIARYSFNEEVFGLTWDGESLWFINNTELCCLNESMKVVNRYSTGQITNHTGLAWDGNYFWITNGRGLTANPYSNDFIYKVKIN